MNKIFKTRYYYLASTLIIMLINLIMLINYLIAMLFIYKLYIKLKLFRLSQSLANPMNMIWDFYFTLFRS